MKENTIGIAEGLIDVETDNEWLEAWQQLIDTGQMLGFNGQQG